MTRVNSSTKPFRRASSCSLTRCPITTVFPYSAIVELEIDFPYGSVLCSGWMIGPDTVATAAHCLYYSGLGGWAQNVMAYPGRDGTLAPFGSVLTPMARAMITA
ncbi:MAG: hypothetical protein DCC52_15630 [Chloroflexi bacterium]|nr:MAG: hypothetical protein DCC52_15630 [Chloroflexota bacterium]